MAQHLREMMSEPGRIRGPTGISGPLPRKARRLAAEAAPKRLTAFGGEARLRGLKARTTKARKLRLRHSPMLFDMQSVGRI